MQTTTDQRLLRGCGRGRGAHVDHLDQIRTERQITQRRINTLPANARQERVARKRAALLERMLLPYPVPKKRQTKRESPNRQHCIMVEDAEPYNEHPYIYLVEAQASTSSIEHTPTRLPEAGIDIEFVDPAVGFDEDTPDLGGEVVIQSPSSSSPSSPRLIGVNNQNSASVVEDWLTSLPDSDDDDSELNHDDSVFSLPILGRTVTTEPACDSDLTPFQSEVLQKEDDANDQALRCIVADDCYTFDWNSDRNTFLGQRETFTETSGPTFKVTDQTRVIDIFDKMFDVDFIDLLCTETNRYADQQINLLKEQNKVSDNSRLHRWTPTHRDEMISFLTIQILQGLYPLPEEQAYFTFNGYGTMPYFAKIISYNRYILIKKFLHFVDSQTLKDTSRICKIRPVVKYFNNKFSSLYMPSQEIAIDESLLKWHGKLSFAQKISSKAARVGVKTYELCESSSGYLWKFFIYTGKEKPQTTTEDNERRKDVQTDSLTNDRPDEDDDIDRPEKLTTGNRSTNATAQIIYDLIEPLLNRGHTLIMDNFYNSPLLSRYLKINKTDCYGTLRLNREFVPEFVKTLTKTELRKGEVVATYCSDLMIMVWRDANIVSMISTYHNLQIETQDKNDKWTYKPSIVLDYNKNMGGVDRRDQYLSTHPSERVRTRTWYKKLFRRLYNDAIFNCFVIFSTFHKKISHRQFRSTLAEDLLKRHRHLDLTTEYRLLNVRTSTTGQVKTTVVRRNVRHSTLDRPIVEHNHFPIRTGSKHTCCRMCPKRRRTIWKCEECNVNLCIDPCFKAYHKP